MEAKTSNKIIRQRLKERTGKTARASDARIEDFPKLSELYEPPKELPALELAAIEASKVRPEATMTNVLKALADRRAQADRKSRQREKACGSALRCKIAVRTADIVI